jgi:hypothetical protein
MNLLKGLASFASAAGTLFTLFGDINEGVEKNEKRKKDEAEAEKKKAEAEKK